MRRTWMLLFVIALLAIFMAVPALAAETDHTPEECPNGGHCYGCCDGEHSPEDGWIALNEDNNGTSITLSRSNKYYLETNVSAIIKPQNLTTLCLNGKELSGYKDSSGKLYRPIDVVSANATVSIVDCSEPDGTGLSKGKIYATEGLDSSDGAGIRLQNTNTTINFYNGTIVGATAVSTKTTAGGGAVCVLGEGAAFNFVGGKIIGADVPANGGSVWLKGTKNSFTMGREGNTSKTFPSIEGGSVESGNGGSIYVGGTNANFTLHSGLITDGTAANNGGNLYLTGSATLNITGGKIAEGTANGTAGTAGCFAYGANVYISGGEVDKLSCSGTVYLSGSPTLTDLRLTTTPGNLIIEKPAEFAGDVTIASGSQKNVLIARPEGLSEAGWLEYDKLISTASPKIRPSDAGTKQLAYQEDGIRFYEVTNQKYNCYCGMIGGSHSIGCQEENPGCYDVLWTAWDGSGNLVPEEDGTHRYYLTDTVSGRSTINVGSGADTSAVKNHVVIDMNGHSITMNDRTRAFYLYCSSSLSLCNTSATESAITGSGNNNGSYVFVYCNGNTVDRTFNLHDRVTLTLDDTGMDTPAANSAQGGFGNVGQNSDINLYGGTVEVNLQNAMTNGGIFYIAGNNQIHIYGTAQLKGGKAQNGGAVYVNTGNLTMDGGTISGCTATGNGDAVFSNNTLYLNGGSIQDGDVYLDSGEKISVGAEFTANTPIKVTLADTNKAFTTGISNVARAEAVKGYFAVQNDCKIGIDDGYELYAFTGDWGASINGGADRYGLAAAARKAAEGDLITLHSAGADADLDENVWLDLNGNSVTGTITVAEGKILKLVDSANINYVDAGATVAAIEGNVERAFITNGKLGGNYRFLTIKDAETGAYSAHRIYLAVKSTVLVPSYNDGEKSAPAIKYRTVFKCDETVADLVDDYGVDVNFNGTLYEGFTHNSSVVAGDENSKVAGLINVVGTQADGEADIFSNAYITLNDGIGGKVTSANSTTRTLKQLVEAADDSYNVLTASQKSAMGNLWTDWGETMKSWGWDLANTEAAN